MLPILQLIAACLLGAVMAAFILTMAVVSLMLGTALHALGVAITGRGRRLAARAAHGGCHGRPHGR